MGVGGGVGVDPLYTVTCKLYTESIVSRGGVRGGWGGMDPLNTVTCKLYTESIVSRGVYVGVGGGWIPSIQSPVNCTQRV